MPKHLEYVAVIDSITRLTNSRNGNPRFKIHFEDGQTTTTQSDASVSYEMTNHNYPGRFRIKATPAGKVWGIEPVQDD